jgi:NDP-sugar pyrophosphorylase family protein
VRALVLAAGKSTRIAALASGGAKPLLRVRGRTLLEWNLLWLRAHGMKEVWINLHHRANDIRDAIGDGRHAGVSVRYSEEPVLLGTAGAWKRVAGVWPRTWLVVYGDNLMRFDLSRLLNAHRHHGGAATVALFEPKVHANTADAGGRAALDAQLLVRAFDENGAVAGPINAGVYALESSVADEIDEGYMDFGHDILPRLASAGQLRGHVIEPDGFCLGVDTPERFARALSLLDAGAVTL